MALEPLAPKDPSETEPIKNRCTAHRRNGDRCRKYAIRGSNVCSTHGGSAPQVQRAAQVRLLMAADNVAGELVRIALDGKKPDAVRVQAILAVLDRAGISTRQQVEIHTDTVKPEWEQRVDGAVKFLPPDWSELADPNVIDAEVVEDDYVTPGLDPNRMTSLSGTATEPPPVAVALPSRPAPHPAEDPPAPWMTDEGALETERRRADEHRQRTRDAAREVARPHPENAARISGGLQPRHPKRRT